MELLSFNVELEWTVNLPAHLKDSESPVNSPLPVLTKFCADQGEIRGDKCNLKYQEKKPDIYNNTKSVLRQFR